MFTADLIYGPFHPPIVGETLTDVQREFCRQRDDSGLGYRDWGNALVKRDGAPFCEISYNGRAWPLKDCRIDKAKSTCTPIAEAPA